MSSCTIYLKAKCSDRCYTAWPDGQVHSDYAPEIPGLGGGDYLEIEIDIDTGKIVNWPGREAVEDAMAERDGAW